MARRAAPAIIMELYFRFGIKSLSMVLVTMGYTTPITETISDAHISSVKSFLCGL